MSRLARLGLATVLLVGALAAGRLALPGGMVACSCLALEPGAPLFTGQEQVVVVGTVGPGDGSGIFPFAVERWFKGGDAATIRLTSATQRLPDGSFVTNSCGVDLTPGWHVILVASLRDGIYDPSPCQPFAAIETADGQRTLQAAIATFGDGAPPGTTPGGTPESPGGPTIDLALIAILGVLAVVIAVLFGALFLAFGRRDGTAAP